ncbi:MAG: acyl-CoA dehydrogenase family protein [Chloroflexota bacterium]
MTARGIYFKEEHEMFFREVRRFAETELLPHRLEWEETGRIPKWVDKRLAELGCFGITLPEQDGGQGCDVFHAVAVAEGLAYSGMRALMATVVFAVDMFPPLLREHGTREQKEKYLLPLLRGEKRAALSVTEPNAGCDVASVETRARLDGEHWVIDGRKIFITSGDSCDYNLVLARTSGQTGRYRGLSLLFVDRDNPGYHVDRTLDKIGSKQMDNSEIALDNCRVPRDSLLGEEGKGFYLAMRALDSDRLMASITAVTLGGIALEEGLKYAQERTQFGQPLGEFQITRHRVAELAVELEAARQLVYHACWLYGQGLPAGKEISMAKLKAGGACWGAVDGVLQMFGGYGYIEDTPISHYWRDLRVSRISAGTDEIQKEIIASHLLPRRAKK